MDEQKLHAYTVAKLIGPGLGVELKSFAETFPKQPSASPQAEAAAREGYKRLSEQLKPITRPTDNG